MTDQFPFKGYKIDSVVMVNSFGVKKIKYRKLRRSIIGKTFMRNNLKLITRKHFYDVPCGKTIEIRSLYKQPVMNTLLYYTSEGFYIQAHRIRRYYVEV